MAELPEGTVTFLRTDLEGSMTLMRSLGPRYDTLNLEHQQLVREAIAEEDGHVVRTEGDAIFAVFSDAPAAARTAVAIQRRMATHAWPPDHAFRVRIGLHTGAAHRVGDDYGGFEVNRAARIAAAGWGGQIIVSDAARALISDDEAGGWSLRDLGPHRLKDLPEPERLFQLEAAGLAQDFRPLRSGVSPTDRLPQRLTALIGRDDELEMLDRLIGETRLLTLTGPGGAGKTTLALELARRHADAYLDGAWFVDLQAIREVEQVRAEIARALGLLDGTMGTAAERLSGYIATHELLLVIDNFEQVIGAADVVGELLVASPRSRIVVTSRVALRLRAEQEFVVRPMRVDGDVTASDATRLFIDRARRARPDLRLGDREDEVVLEICRQLDGLPLAIELCAARTAMLPLRTIRDRLRERQALPGSGPRDLPDRQRTMQEAVAWSYGLLDPPLRRLFARLAVFVESFDHAQAEAVCGPADELGVDVLDGIVRLAEQSLLGRVDDAVGGVRFGWLETIRDHALERLTASGAARDLRDRHARAFADLATEAIRHIPGADQAWWIDRLEADGPNVRAAMLHALDVGDVESALRLTAGLWRYWLQTGRLSEGRDLARRAMALPGADAPTVLRVRALDALGGLAYWAGDGLEANAIYEQELELARSIGDRPGTALALLNVFFTREYAGDIEGAMAAKAEAEELYRELGDDFGLARLQEAGFLTVMAHGLAAPQEFGAELEERARAVEVLANPYVSRSALAYRAFGAFQAGELKQAMEWLVRGIRSNLAVRERTDAALSLQFVVVVSPMIGRPDLGATIHGAARGAFDRMGIRPPAEYAELVGMDPIPILREALGAVGFYDAVAAGRGLSLQEASDLVDEAAATLP
jgi:predicted ATPase/class 3 adenylate cyclase